MFSTSDTDVHSIKIHRLTPLSNQISHFACHKHSHEQAPTPSQPIKIMQNPPQYPNFNSKILNTSKLSKFKPQNNKQCWPIGMKLLRNSKRFIWSLSKISSYEFIQMRHANHNKRNEKRFFYFSFHFCSTWDCEEVHKYFDFII